MKKDKTPEVISSLADSILDLMYYADLTLKESALVLGEVMALIMEKPFASKSGMSKEFMVEQFFKQCTENSLDHFKDKEK